MEYKVATCKRYIMDQHTGCLLFIRIAPLFCALLHVILKGSVTVVQGRRCQKDAAIACAANIHPEDGHAFRVMEAPGPEEVC